MTSQGSALARFERAVKIGNPNIVLAAAPERFPAAAARFGARLVSERRLLVAEAQLTFAALQTLSGPERETGGEALCALLERHHETESARYVEQWLQASA